MKRIAVQTSGGDTPGMNAAVRAVVRAGLDKGWEIYGVRYGYLGLVNDNLVPLGARDVGGIIQQGGTMLGTSRCPEFETEEGQIKALRTLKQSDIEALVVIGGNGAQAGAQALSQKGCPTVGVAATINNDLYGTDIAIGVDTALNIALDAIDRLKVTASSHQRAFIVDDKRAARFEEVTIDKHLLSRPCFAVAFEIGIVREAKEGNARRGG